MLAPAWLLLVLQYVGMVQVADTQLSMLCPGALPVSVQFFTGVCFFCSSGSEVLFSEEPVITNMCLH